jgi:hypothetical protein
MTLLKEIIIERVNASERYTLINAIKDSKRNLVWTDEGAALHENLKGINGQTTSISGTEVELFRIIRPNEALSIKYVKKHNTVNCSFPYCWHVQNSNSFN